MSAPTRFDEVVVAAVKSARAAVADRIITIAEFRALVVEFGGVLSAGADAVYQGMQVAGVIKQSEIWLGIQEIVTKVLAPALPIWIRPVVMFPFGTSFLLWWLGASALIEGAYRLRKRLKEME